MGFLRQIWIVTLLGLESLPQRVGAALVTVIGVACAVAVMISLLAVAQGVIQSIYKHDNSDLAIVLPGGAAAEYLGSFTRADAATISEAPGVKRDPSGKPMVQPFATVIVELQKKDGSTANLFFRGSGPMERRLKPYLQYVNGHIYRAGVHELIVGRAAQRTFKGLDVGDRVMLRGTQWTVVGTYAANGGIDENAIAADVDTVLSAFGRTTYQSMEVALTSPEDFNKFKDALTTNPQLKVQVKRLSDYYYDQLKPLISLFDFVGYFVGSVMAIGAVFGALTTMYSIVDARVREIATLRALGFGGGAVVLSIMIESLVLAIPGALLGAAIAALLFNNEAISTSGISFSLAVTPGLVETGILWALAIGLIGGFMPAIRAARVPVATALRAT